VNIPQWFCGWWFDHDETVLFLPPDGEEHHECIRCGKKLPVVKVPIGQPDAGVEQTK
jgi:hypothetical protein